MTNPASEMKDLVAKRIKIARREKGLSQNQLGELLEITKQGVSCIEKAKINTEPDRLKKLSEILGKPIEFFTNANIPANEKVLLPKRLRWPIKPPEAKNPNAVILGKLSAIKRSGVTKGETPSEKQIHQAARIVGRSGGLAGGEKGGLSRAAALTPERRSALAQQAANARWGNITKKVQEEAPPSFG